MLVLNFSASRFSSCWQAGRGTGSGCLCCLYLCQCFLSVWTLLICIHPLSSICIYTDTHCTYMLSLTTVWRWGHGAAAALPLLGYGNQQLLPPPTALHRTTPVGLGSQISWSPCLQYNSPPFAETQREASLSSLGQNHTAGRCTSVPCGELALFGWESLGR